MNQSYDDMGPHYGAGIADLITVELHSSVDGALIYSASDVELMTSGIASVTVPAAYGDSYYIYVKHRNSIATSSAAPVSFAGSTISYDFSTSADQAYGSNQQNLGSGVYGFFGGDVSQDGLLDASDLIQVDNDAAMFAMGYLTNDANGDGLIDLSDMIIVDNNVAYFVYSVLPY